ncbi:hypothetical protein [Desulfovulcanus sp.]
MSFQEELLAKWHRCHDRRYPVLIVVKASLDDQNTMQQTEEFARVINAEILNFQKRHQGELDRFFTWQSIRDELYKAASNRHVIAIEIEPFYAKWPEKERLAFLRNLLRSSPKHSITLIISCQENLSELQNIDKNSRGIIWVAPK